MTGMPNGAPGYAPERRPLSAGWIAFIIIDIVLVLGVIIYGVIVLGGSDTNDDRPAASAAPTTQGESPSEEPATEPSQSEEPSPDETTAEDEDSVVRVASPSGNIECAISDDSARCTIADLTKKPKKVKGCDGTVGYVLVVSADGVDKPCIAKKDQPTAANDGAKQLEYGSKISEKGFTCVSEADGMGCTHDKTGKGFTIAKAGPLIF